MRIPLFVLATMLATAGCGNQHLKTADGSSRHRFAPTPSDSFTALDTTTGKLCLTYDFSTENKVISELRGKSDDDKRKILSDLPVAKKQRILERLNEPDGLPVCADLKQHS